MEQTLVYFAYGVAALGAVALYAALPRDGRPSRRGLVFMLMAASLGAIILLFQKVVGGAATQVYFYILAALTLGGAVRVVTHPRPVFSALFFIMVVLATAALLIISGAEFLGAALVIVYAGAILVTYVFVIFLAQQAAPSTGGQFAAALHYDKNAREPMASVFAGFILVGTLAGAIVSGARTNPGTSSPADSPTGNTLNIAKLLLTDHAISVELAGLLLTVAMIGAIALARKKLPHPEHEQEEVVPGEIGRTVKPF